MRWLIAAAAAVLAAWLLYLASPYWAMWRLASALDAADTRAIAAGVNFRALRVSFAKQIAESMSRPGAKDPDAQLAVGAAAAAGQQLLEEFVTPERLSDLLRMLQAGDGSVRSDVPRLRPSLRSASDLLALVGASRWRGFRTIYVVWPPGMPADRQPRAQFRFSRLAWRLVSIDLPADIRRRLAAEIAQRYGLPLPN